MMKLKLGVNIDHVATLRQARRGIVPSTLEAALAAEEGGADGITLHLREDRRHIQDFDLTQLLKAVHVPLNLEMALHPEIVRIALERVPEKICIVPEKRQELTTEGGLDAAAQKTLLKKLLPKFHQKKIQVSLFINPDSRQIQTAWEVGADAVEIHTGTYANVSGKKREAEWRRIRLAAKRAKRLGLKVHAGHGLDYENVRSIAAIPEIEELNIGHSIVSRAVFVGMRQAVREMKNLMK